MAQPRAHHRSRVLLPTTPGQNRMTHRANTVRPSSEWLLRTRTNLVLRSRTAKINSVNIEAGGPDGNGGSERGRAGSPGFAAGIATRQVPEPPPLRKTSSHGPATGLPEI